MEDDTGWQKLTALCDGIGPRICGSPALDRAVKWAASEMKESGLQNVQTPLVKIPHWVRGEESVTLLSPYHQRLSMLGLGGSIGTPAAGITAGVVAVSTFADLDRLDPQQVAGKIVVFNPPWEGYGRTVAYRWSGADHASKLGAIAVLIRSVTPFSLRTPHTGSMEYSGDVPKIPAAAVSVEDAALLQRLYQEGRDVKVHLYMEAKTLPDADGANVIGQIPGREHPEEVVVVGGHLDSWDVGQGAHDDAAGCIIALQAASLIHSLGLQPRRTLRVVFWTNEESGLAGGKAYRNWIGPELRNHVAAIEIDSGCERAVGFSFGLHNGDSGSDDAQQQAALAKAREISRLLDCLQTGAVTAGGGGADISPLAREGVPAFGLRTVGLHYFDWHHSPADTLDKINPNDFRINVATVAVMAYVLADMPERFPNAEAR